MQPSKKYWFVRKSYGWGRVPASRAGRIIVGAYIVILTSWTLLYSNMAQIDQSMRAGTELEYNAGGNLFVFLVPVILMTILLLLICYKTGESPKWQWGAKK